MVQKYKIISTFLSYCTKNMKTAMKRFFRASLYLLLIAAWLPAHSQVVMERKVRFGIILDGDTIPYYRLKDVNVIASASLLSDYEIRHNQKLIRNVKKMLPYAKIGKQRLDILEQQIADLPKKQRRAAIRAAEKNLLADFSDELKGCTISQGKVLLKLQDRRIGMRTEDAVGYSAIIAQQAQLFLKLFDRVPAAAFS